MKGFGRLIAGAVAGAAIVAMLAALLGAALGELADPAVIAVFALAGAVLGAFAWGAVGYERDHESPFPSAAYSEGALADEPPK